MMTHEIRSVLEKRIQTDDEWAWAVEQCWKEEVAIMSHNIDETIAFLDSECTAEEFSWLSEVFEDVAEVTKSAAFIECLIRVAKKYPEECASYNVWSFINSAKALVEE